MSSSIKSKLEEPGKDASEIRGVIKVAYSGKYDGVAINAQIMGSNSLVSFMTCNGREIGGSKSRLFVPCSDMSGGRIEFAARIEPTIKGPHEARLRASIIEQHKEVESDLIFSTRR